MTTDLIEPTTTTTTAPDVAGVVMMDAAEARANVHDYRMSYSKAERALDRCRAILLGLYEREGWKALGYDTWRACAVAELDMSQAQVYRLLGAAQVTRDIAPALLDFSHDEKNLPEAVLRPLLQLDSPEERQAAATLAIDAAGGDVPSSAQMRQAVEQVRPPQTCGHPITVGATKIDGIVYCPSCASQLMAAQNERAAAARARDDALGARLGRRAEEHAAERQTGLSPQAAAHRALVAACNDLVARKWLVTRTHDGYRLKAPTGDEYEMDDAGVLAAARLLRERSYASPDALMEAVNAIEDAPSPAGVPIDIAAMASAYALTIETHGDRYLLYWPDEADDLAQMEPLDADLVREWLQGDAPRQVVARAQAAGWDLRARDRGQTLVYYHRTRDGKGTAEYSDAALAAGEALRIDQKETRATTTGPACTVCGAPSIGHANIGGECTERCQACATAAERDDLKEQLGAQYVATVVRQDLGGTFHRIAWAHDGGQGDYSYSDALTMLHATATQVRTEGAKLRQACERAVALGATIDYLGQRADGRLSVVSPAGYQQAGLWCNADELMTLCNAWEKQAGGQVAHAPPSPPPLLPDGPDIWFILGDLLRSDMHALLRACRAALESAADSDEIEDDVFEALARRIGDAERALVEEAAG